MTDLEFLTGGGGDVEHSEAARGWILEGSDLPILL